MNKSKSNVTTNNNNDKLLVTTGSWETDSKKSNFRRVTRQFTKSLNLTDKSLATTDTNIQKPKQNIKSKKCLDKSLTNTNSDETNYKKKTSKQTKIKAERKPTKKKNVNKSKIVSNKTDFKEMKQNKRQKLDQKTDTQVEKSDSDETDIEMQSFKRLKRQNIKPKFYKMSSSESEDEEPKSRKNRTFMELTVEEIKAQWKKYAEFKKKNQDLLQKAKEFEEQLKKDDEKEKEYEEKQREKEERKKNFKMRDCKHFTNEQLTKMFENDFKWIDDIFHGRIYCERHEQFKVDTPLNRLTGKDLMYNVSCEVFTEDQLIHLVTLFRAKYDEGNLWKHSSYYWKVLLPEYCLKIFMKCYKLQRDKAMEYLNSIPVPIEKYFNIEKLESKRH